jgi:three-Cys-motif partner protein
VANYGSAYTTALKNSTLKKYYIDGFSGAGIHRSRKTGKQVAGSPTRALNVSPPFDGYYFIDLDAETTATFDLFVEIESDCSEYLTRELFSTIQYTKFNRALCLLDPYGLHLDWEVMRQAGQSRAVDMFLNFPVMDMNRNAIWRNPEKVPQGGVERMTKF